MKIDDDIVAALLIYCPEISFKSVMNMSRFGLDHLYQSKWRFEKDETEYSIMIKSLPYVELSHVVKPDDNNKKEYFYYRFTKEKADEIFKHVTLLKNI